jgi:PAS domain S-box-containing protein
MHDLVLATRYLNDLLFVVLAIVAFQHWRQRRESAAAWAATTFLVLAAVALIALTLPEEVSDGPLVWVQKLLLAGLLLFPYFLYRFAAVFEPTAKRMDALAVALTVAIIAFSLAPARFPGPGDPRPVWFRYYLIGFIVQWTTLLVIVAVRLWRGGRGKPTVARRRMWVLSAASVLLSLVLMVSGTAPNSDTETLTTVIVGLLTTGSALLFFIGLAPPTFVRLSWRRPEERAMQGALLQLMAATTPTEVTDQLLPNVAGMLGGRGAALIDADDRVIGQHGTIGKVDSDDAAAVRLEMQAGTLHIWTSPHTPFFGREEVALLSSFGVIADLALARCGLISRLVQSELRLRESQEIAHIGGWEWDIETDKVVWSDEMYRIFGHEPNAVEASLAGLMKRIHSEDRESTKATVEGALAARSPFTFDFRIVLPDGQVRVLHVQGKILGGDGEPLRMVGTGQDVTERKRAEDELHAAYARERASREAFERTNGELESFVYSVSHDLKSPMISLLGYLDYFKLDFSQGLPEEALHFLDRMSASGAYMQALIQDLLELSRVGRSQTAKELVDLEVILEDIRGEVRLSYPYAPIEIGAMPVLLMNPVRVRQLLTNLIGNALDHAERPDVRVEVTADAREDGSVMIVVQDDGPGIPEAYREKVFGVFERLQPRDGPASGTGIGLAVCRKIMEVVGGTIEVADSPAGAKMCAWFPPDTVAHPPGIRPVGAGSR